MDTKENELQWFKRFDKKSATAESGMKSYSKSKLS